MACSNCFNGCTEIVSDKCVKYTGIPIPALGIETGDPLLVVENKIIEKILTLMDGSGIIPIIDENDLCDLVSSFLPCCDATTITLNDVISALIKSICDIDARLAVLTERVIDVEEELAILNAPYNIPLNCEFPGADVDSDTHEIVQATMDKVCAIAADLFANYVRVEDINSYIETFLADQPATGKNYLKMIPRVAYPYFGTLTGFDGTGVGSGVWEQVYLCNGDHSTPDLRGVTLIGATDTLGTLTMDNKVNPSFGTSNPPYPFSGGIVGNNGITLSVTQLPPHDHSPITIAPTVNLTGAVQYISESFNNSGVVTGIFTKTTGFNVNSTPGTVNSGNTGSFAIDANHTHTATPTSVGGNLPHQNYQPGKACYYIMYIPT